MELTIGSYVRVRGLVAEGPATDAGDVDEADEADEDDAVEDERRKRWQRFRRLPRIERRMLVLLLCAPLLGALGVIGAELVSDARIADELDEARRGELIGPSEAGPTPLGTQAARYTECTSFSLGLGDPADEDPITRAMLGNAYTGCERLGSAVDEFATSGELREGYPYLRYWHGYSVISRPALALTGVEGARWIAFAVSALAIGGMCAAVKRSFGGVPTLLLVVPALLTSDMVVAGLSASTAIGSSCAWLGGWMAMSAVGRCPTWRTAGIVAALAGVTSAYLDLMTTMPGTLALTVAGATLGFVAAGRTAGAWTIPVAAAIGWAAGLVWMWGSKWLLAAAVLGIERVDDAVRSQIGFRLSSGTDGVSDSRTEGLTDNLSVWWDRPTTPWVIAVTLGALVALAAVTAWQRRRGRQGGAVAWGVALGAVVAVVPVVAWYVVLNNHSQIHPQLVYRSLPLALGAAAVLVWVALRADRGVET